MIYATLTVKIHSCYEDSVKNIQEEISMIEEVDSVEITFKEVVK